MDLVVDSFAGGGGASLGISWALGRGPDIAINHDAAAIAMHAENHPDAQHCTEDVWKLSPRKVTRGRPVGLLWASPDCTHFSRAKGGQPVKKHIRSLAWVVIKWAVEARPRLIILENVREFEDWGPLVPRWVCGECDWRGTEGQAVLARRRRNCPRCESRTLRETDDLVPDPGRKGLTFRRWAGRLRNLGYKVQWKTLDAADYGAPTHRRRLFLIARRDGEPILWPQPTHGDPKKIGLGADLFGPALQPWRTAAECIDWSIPCPSIFDRKRPLAEKTLRRIAMGVKRYVLENPRPFLVRCNSEKAPSENNAHSLDAPINTITADPRYGLVTPLLSRICQGGGNGKYANGVDEPLTTVVSKNEHLLIAPTLIQTGWGEREGQAPRVLVLHKPMGTVMGDCKQALVYSFLTKYFGTAVGQPVDAPLGTATGKDRFGLVTVAIDGEPYVIVDIGMRMLRPRELARGQGFPDSYLLTGTATSQVERIGNSVCPVLAQVLVEANYVADVVGAVP